jgi:RNA recognition motif-containing protein
LLSLTPPQTGASKHYAFLEFKYESVAQIVQETMDNYLLSGHILVCKVVPNDQVHPKLWVGANRKFRVVPKARKELKRRAAVRFFLCPPTSFCCTDVDGTTRSPRLTPKKLRPRSASSVAKTRSASNSPTLESTTTSAALRGRRLRARRRRRRKRLRRRRRGRREGGRALEGRCVLSYSFSFPSN